MKNIIKVAVTGGIGSGKNVVADAFKRLGCQIIDTDEIVRRIYFEDNDLRQKIAAEFGQSVIDTDGNLSRKKLAEIVFSDKNKIDKLNGIIHPEVKKQIDEIIFNIERNGYRGCVVVLVPLLIEAGMQSDFDKVIVVVSDERTRIDRCVKRDGVLPSDIKKRMMFQLPDIVKIKYADYVIDNNGLIDCVYDDVNKVYNQIIEINKPNK